jgi:tRNA threonylcarbamoyladenosine biosynthesis protein TsaE
VSVFAIPAMQPALEVRTRSRRAIMGNMGNHSYVTTTSAEETTQLGRELAAKLRPGSIVLLRGDLGAGKTTLVKGIAEGFQAASAGDVTSPTFTLIHEYRGPEVTLYHIDLYRIDTQRELDTLALDDLIDPKSILLIEWGEKFARFTRERDAEIAIELVGGDNRRIIFNSSNQQGDPID